MVLCQLDGRIIAANRTLARIVHLPESRRDEITTLAELAQLLDCRELQSRFEALTASDQAIDKLSLNGQGQPYEVILQRFDQIPHQDLVLIELNPQDGNDEQSLLLEAGRMTSRLIHDFKNQMGGLKLYAAYLKKRFADQPEGLEIAEKIVQGLNAMAEQAALISKLTRPLELKRELHDPALIVSQAVNDHKIRAEARQVAIEATIEEQVSSISLDVQQIRLALGSIIARAIETSPEGGTVRIQLQSQPGEIQIEVADEGELLTDQQRKVVFDFLSSDRINATALDLALARRIIERHGGEVTALAGSTVGTVVKVVMKG